MLRKGYSHSADTQHGNLHRLSVTMSRVTYFILQAYTGTGVSHSRHRKNSGEVLEKMQVNGPEHGRCYVGPWLIEFGEAVLS